MKLKLIALLTLSSVISVNSYAEKFNYTYGEVSFGRLTGDEDANMVGIAGSYQIGDMFYVLGGFDKTSYDDDYDFKTQSLGFGAHTALARTTDAYLNFSFEHNYDSFASENSQRASIGVRQMMNRAVEINGELTNLHVNNAGDATILSVGTLLHMNDNFAVGLSFGRSDFDTNFGTLYLRASI